MRVCLVTVGQPATNPRLVKEADALAEAGHEVRVVGAQWARWADAFDGDLIARRKWQCDVLQWRREVNPRLFWKSRLRHYVARHLADVPVVAPLVEPAALSRIGPDLLQLVCRSRADLLVAHNLGALPIALAAGKAFGAPVL